MSVAVRFAPSPTGYLHVGNARTALITWLFARNQGGSLLLRIDDTDLERSKDEYTQDLKESLTWLGIDWDDYAHQRDRTERYGAQIEALKAAGRIYACYETPEELSLKRKTLLSRGKPPIYDRAALDLTDEQKAKFEAEGRAPHWRFKLEHTPIEWTDMVRGEVTFQGGDLSDPVVLREDGSPLYHLCSVIDDLDFNITHIVRGEDHVSNTATHIQMFEALIRVNGEGTVPAFAHLPLISDAEGGKLSKRLGSLSIRDIRSDDGLEPEAVQSLMARLGTSDPIEPMTSVTPLIESFDFTKFSRGTPKFDPEELNRLNAKILHNMSYEQAKPRLEALNLGHIDASFWGSVHANLEKLRDIEDWWRIAHEPVEPLYEEADFLAQAAELLPPAPWSDESWSAWTNAVKEATGRKGKQLFMPLRLALTGMQHGPELGIMMQLIGPEKVRERLLLPKKAA